MTHDWPYQRCGIHLKFVVRMMIRRCEGELCGGKAYQMILAPAGSGVLSIVRCWVPASNISNTPNRWWSWLCPTKVPDPWCVGFNNKPSYNHIWLQGHPRKWQRADVDRWIGMVPCGEVVVVNHVIIWLDRKFLDNKKPWLVKKSCLLWCGSEDEVKDFNWIHCKAVIDAGDLWNDGCLSVEVASAAWWNPLVWLFDVF